jgi:hypothetical protein
MIFKELDCVGSTCLGLASKRLYSIYKGLHGKVSLTAWCLLPSRRYSGRHLYELLGEWIAPLMFCRPKRKFITAEKMGKFKEQYYALGGFWRRVDAMDSRALDEMMMARIEAELRVGGRFDQDFGLMARMRIGHGVIKRFWSRCTPVRGILQL